MKKNVIVLAGLMILIICLMGVFLIMSNENVYDTGNQKGRDIKLTYTIENGENIYNSKYSKRGVYIDTEKRPDSPWYYTIASGTKNSGGYGIIVKEVNIDEEENIEIIVEEISPEPDAITTMAITYPTCKVVFNKQPKSVVVKSVDGSVFEEGVFSDETIYFNPE